MLALMHMGMRVLAAVGVLVMMLMRTRRPCLVRMRMISGMGVLMITRMPMGVGMNGAVLMDVRMFMRGMLFLSLKTRLSGAATANCAHDFVSCVKP
jgi:hypothetical protein